MDYEYKINVYINLTELEIYQLRDEFGILHNKYPKNELNKYKKISELIDFLDIIYDKLSNEE